MEIEKAYLKLAHVPEDLVSILGNHAHVPRLLLDFLLGLVLQHAVLGHLELRTDIGRDVRREQRGRTARGVIAVRPVRVRRGVALLVVELLLLRLLLLVPVLLGLLRWRGRRRRGILLELLQRPLDLTSHVLFVDVGGFLHVGHQAAAELLGGLGLVGQLLDGVLVGRLGRVVVDIVLVLRLEKVTGLNNGRLGVRVPEVLLTGAQDRLALVVARVLDRLARQDGEIIDWRLRPGTHAHLGFLAVLVHGRELL